ncbi:hypothetical protein ACR80S_01515 [Halomonas sp. MA07-2]|uniref:hypothetical protein n=1 Tax=unclassified Halomonas TaxID=2609666 RepID=UPI003EEC2BBC
MADHALHLNDHHDALATGGGESLVVRLQAAFREAGAEPAPRLPGPTLIFAGRLSR